MPWDDFVSEFTDLSINHLINTSIFSFSKTWKEFTKVEQTTWISRKSLNPQKSFDLLINFFYPKVVKIFTK